MKRKPYPSDLTDEQWAVLEELIPPAKPGGCPRQHDMREVLNALFYRAREGCSWRAIPHDFGVPWKTAYNYFRAWSDDGTWDRTVTALLMRNGRAAGRDVDPPKPATSTASRSRRPRAGSSGATTAARRCRGASATSSWTAWACCWPWS